jgi:hypothetical protein
MFIDRACPWVLATGGYLSNRFLWYQPMFRMKRFVDTGQPDLEPA